MTQQTNVLGTPLQQCGTRPLTGYRRDGYCSSCQGDSGQHYVCAVVNDEFLEFSRSRGNDLITPWPKFDFPGLVAGDRWCLCVNRWVEAQQAGFAPPVHLESTHVSALEYIDLKTLRQYALDASE